MPTNNPHFTISYEPTSDLSPEKEALFYNLREQAKKGKRGIIEKFNKNYCEISQ